MLESDSSWRALVWLGLGVVLALGAVAVADEVAPDGRRSLRVTATAYNSLPGQTQGDPTLTAWGDRLEPGMKSIAVSRDLIELGLGHGTVVEIEGLDGPFVVRDKMAKRWRHKIDIYMGEDVSAARQWGRREVVIHWRP